jgi:superfamily I DNA/RNA helicase
VEKARSLAAQGFEVLLTCFNVALAQELQKREVDVTVAHFHGLCKEMARESGFSLRKPASEQEYNDVILPDELFNAATNLGPQYDAIVVDEGQDFKETYWVALSALLRQDGIFYVFFDDNQNLYGGTAALKGLVDEEPFPLSENCRNTQTIHKLVSKFHSQPDSLICRGPQGHAPELLYYRDAAQLIRQVQSRLHHLVVDEHISPQDIVILTPRSQERTNFKAGMRLGSFVLTEGQRNWQNGIQVSSIHAFKGLERRVVIIAEIDEYVRYQPEIVMYVGCSRARTYLVLCADENIPADLKRSIESVCKG